MRKGFTLAELLAVISILGLIALITIPNVLTKLKSSKEDLYNNQIEEIKAGAQSYITYEISHLKTSSPLYTPVTTHTSTTITVTLNDLQEAGMLDKNISNPLCDGSDKYFSPEETKIKIKYDGKEFEYEVFNDFDLRQSCTAKK